MDCLFKYETVLNAFDKYLDLNMVDKDAPYSDDVLVVDTIAGYREQLLRMKVKPNFVCLDDFIADVIAPFMEEV